MSLMENTAKTTLCLCVLTSLTFHKLNCYQKNVLLTFYYVMKMLLVDVLNVPVTHVEQS